jgi:hypothetical protein
LLLILEAEMPAVVVVVLGVAIMDLVAQWTKRRPRKMTRTLRNTTLCGSSRYALMLNLKHSAESHRVCLWVL